MDELLREEALLTINLPGDGCSFPWERLPSKQRQSIADWLKNSEDFHEWADHLVIGVYKQEISIDLAMLLAACPTCELERLGKVSIDAGSFDSYRPQRAFALLCNPNPSPPACPRHSFDVSHDWWLFKLWPSHWAEERSHKISTLRNGLPLSSAALQKLERSITVGRVTLATVLQGLAFMTRDPLESMKPVASSPESFRTSDALTRYAYLMGGPVQFDAWLESHEQIDAIESLWDRLNRSTDRKVLLSEGIQDDTCIEILRAQRNSAILLSKRFQKKIETYWRHNTVRPSLTTSLAMCLPRHLIRAVVANMWRSPAQETFKQPLVTSEAVTRSAIRSLSLTECPTKLIKLVKGGHLDFEAALWLILIWYWDGEEAALTALAKRTIVPGLDLISPLPFKEQAVTCLSLVLPFVNVRIRVRWSRVCRAARELIRTPEMEERAMVETLNMIPYGLREFKVSPRFLNYRQEENLHGRDFPCDLIGRKLYTWHLFGAYVKKYLEIPELVTRGSAATECRVWLPHLSAILVARLRIHITSVEPESGKLLYPGDLLLRRTVPLEQNQRIQLTPFALKAHLSDKARRTKTLDVHCSDERPLQVLQAVQANDLKWCTSDGTIFSKSEGLDAKAESCSAESDLLYRIAEYANVTQLDLQKWWVDEKPLTSATSGQQSLAQWIERESLARQDSELLRARQWYKEKIAAMLSQSNCVYSDEEGWAFGSDTTWINSYFTLYDQEKFTVVHRKLETSPKMASHISSVSYSYIDPSSFVILDVDCRHSDSSLSEDRKSP